jgi:hypothetical protein
MLPKPPSIFKQLQDELKKRKGEQTSAGQKIWRENVTSKTGSGKKSIFQQVRNAINGDKNFFDTSTQLNPKPGNLWLKKLRDAQAAKQKQLQLQQQGAALQAQPTFQDWANAYNFNYIAPLPTQPTTTPYTGGGGSGGGGGGEYPTYTPEAPRWWQDMVNWRI